MKWTQFKDKMPKDGSRLLICGKIDTDPMEQPDYPTVYMEFMDYKDGLLISDDDGQEWSSPEPEDYWIYQNSIITPFDEPSGPNYKAMMPCDRCQEYIYFEGKASCDEDGIESCVCPKCLTKDK